MTERLAIEELQSTHERSGFSSGVPALDRYLAQQASQDARRNIASCYVARPLESQRVVGYYTISMTSASLIEFPSEVTRKLPRYESIPAALIGRLAVDEAFRGRGLGGALLLDALARAIRSEIAAYAAVVHAKDDGAADFYRHYGFVPLTGERLRLFAPLSEAAKRLKLR